MSAQAPAAAVPTAGPAHSSLRLSLRSASWPVVVAGIGFAGMAMVVAHNPFASDAPLVCPLYGSTGYLCPGCGGTRAAYALAHGDVLTAATMHPLLTLAAPLLAVLWVRWLLRTQGFSFRPWPFPTWAAIVFCTVLVVFSVLRNIEPFAPFLGPGPGF